MGNVAKVPLDCLVVDVACGLYHGLILTQAGHVYSMGSNAQGQCGVETKNDDDVVAGDVSGVRLVCIPSNLHVTQISCGAIHSVAIASKELIVWGSNREGQLGIDGEVMCISILVVENC
jgi:alpha-tubulin suppressor-like RCC1 family protein